MDNWIDEFIISPNLEINNPGNFETYKYTLIGVAYSKHNCHFICRYLDDDGTTVYENDAMKNGGNSILLNAESTNEDLFPSFFNRNDRIQNTNDYTNHKYKAVGVVYRKYVEAQIDLVTP